MGQGTSLGKEAVVAALGRAGEKADFFSILLACGEWTLLVRRSHVHDSALDWEGNSDTARDRL